VLSAKAYAGLAAVLFGSAYVATGVVLADLSPAATGAWRGLLAAILLLGLAFVSRSVSLSTRHLRPGGWVRLVILGTLGGPLFLLGMNYAVAWSGASTGAVVAGLYAVFGAVLAPLVLNERLTWRTVVGLLTGLVGTAVLAAAPAERPVAGIAAGLGAALAFASYLVLSRRWAEPHGLQPALISAANLTLAGGALLMLAGVSDAQSLVPRNLAAATWLAMAWLAVASVVAQLALMMAVRDAEQRSTSAMLLLNPPFAALLAWLILDETFPPLKLMASAVVLLGMMIVVTERRHQTAP
jgi:probable blue pigment (indigoidine) exporter